MQYRTSSYAEDVFDYFYFEKNLQGDIIAVYNSSGTKLVTYKYDAWGNHTTTYSTGGHIDMHSAINSAFIGGISGLIAGSGANYVKDGMHVTKFVNGKTILKKTIANGTRRAIARQTNALNVHAKQLVISAVKYVASNTFSMAYTMDTN